MRFSVFYGFGDDSVFLGKKYGYIFPYISPVVNSWYREDFKSSLEYDSEKGLWLWGRVCAIGEE